MGPGRAPIAGVLAVGSMVSSHSVTGTISCALARTLRRRIGPFERQFSYGGVADFSSLRAWLIWVRV